jgi:hypothetical protein
MKTCLSSAKRSLPSEPSRTANLTGLERSSPPTFLERLKVWGFCALLGGSGLILGILLSVIPGVDESTRGLGHILLAIHGFVWICLLGISFTDSQLAKKTQTEKSKVSSGK